MGIGGAEDDVWPTATGHWTLESRFVGAQDR
jgi:hypothetical protein